MAHTRPRGSHGFWFMLGVAIVSGTASLLVVLALRYNGITTCPKPTLSG